MKKGKKKDISSYIYTKNKDGTSKEMFNLMNKPNKTHKQKEKGVKKSVSFKKINKIAEEKSRLPIKENESKNDDISIEKLYGEEKLLLNKPKNTKNVKIPIKRNELNSTLLNPDKNLHDNIIRKYTEKIKKVEEEAKKVKGRIIQKFKSIKIPKFDFKKKGKVSEKNANKIEEEKTLMKNKGIVKDNLIKVKSPNLGSKWKNAGAKKIENKSSDDKKLVLPKLSSVYQTDFDRLYDVIEKENLITLSKVAEAFNINKNTAQRWGEILNENELIEYHIPAFGEPEFRKKGLVIEKKTVNKNKRIVIGLSFAGVFLLLLAGFFIFNGLFQNTGDRINVIRPMPPSEKNIIISENIKEAFSGNGSYVCRSGDVKYYIKDQLLRAESVDKKSTVIVKSGFMYTYDVTNDNWIKTEIRKDLVLPGFGRNPKENMGCKKEEVDISLFNVPEGKII